MDFGTGRKRAIVTGGASNIGRAIAHTLVGEGVSVAILDIDMEAAARSVAEIGKLPSAQVKAFRVDITAPDVVAAAVKDAVAWLGGIELLVNCAGGPAKNSTFLERPRADMERDINLNLWGTINMTKAVAPLIMAGAGGAIVNIASNSARGGTLGLSTYAAAKGGVIALTRSLAMELAPKIRVNSVCPDLSLPNDPAEFGRESRWGEKGGGFQDWSAERRQDKASRTPMGRTGNAKDVADTVVFLLSDHAGYVTGQCWAVDGGVVMN